MIEQVEYDPYGRVRRTALGDFDHDGAIVTADIFANLAAFNAPSPAADHDWDGAVAPSDIFAFLAHWFAADATPRDQLSSSGPGGHDNPIGYCGYYYDRETVGIMGERNGGLYQVRHRVYDPHAGRWLQRDPAGFVDGCNLYEYCRGGPGAGVDPRGLACDEIDDGRIKRGPGARSPDDPPILTPAEQENSKRIVERLEQELGPIGTVITTIGSIVVSFVPGVGEAQDYLVLTDGNERWYWRVVAGGSLVLSAVTLGAAPNVAALLRAQEKLAESADLIVAARHATTLDPKKAKSILDGIDPAFLQNVRRFGKGGFYLAEDGGTAILEAVGGATHVIKYTLNLAGRKVLDLTDPAIAKAWGYTGKANETYAEIGERALKEGYEVIKFKATKGAGNNYAVIQNHNAILTIETLAPAPQ